MESERWREGKTSFAEVVPNNDLSGRDLVGILFEEPMSLAHGFFNGATAIDCAFIGVNLSHCEFAEAHLSKTVLKSADLRGTDFVGASFDEVVFEDCNFTGGEWRDTYFLRVSFIGCCFDYTTINLCTFTSCQFCESSTQWLDHGAVNYNVFSGTAFKSSILSVDVLSKNFGLPGTEFIAANVPATVGTLLEDVCLLSSRGVINIPALVEATENEAHNCTGPKMKKLRLEFLTNIIVSLALDHKISVSSMICVENIFTEMARSITNDANFRAAMSAIIAIRNALYQSGMDVFDTCWQFEHEFASRILIHYEKEFSLEDAEELAEMLGYVAVGDEAALQVADVRPGSTIIEMAVTTVATASSVLMATNFLLRQATITVKRVDELKRAVTQFCNVPTAKARHLKRTDPEKVPAIMKSGTVFPEYQPLRELVEKRGKRVVRFDEKADVVVSIQVHPAGQKRGKAGSNVNNRNSVVDRNTLPTSGVLGASTR